MKEFLSFIWKLLEFPQQNALLGFAYGKLASSSSVEGSSK